MFWLYLALAGLARLVVEFSRVNPVLTLGLTEAQWFSVAMIIVGTWQLLKTCHGQESCNYLSRPSPNYGSPNAEWPIRIALKHLVD